LGFRFTRNSKTRDYGIGPVRAIPLAKARQIAAEARMFVAQGGDPIERKRQQGGAELVAAAKAITFKQCAESFIDVHSPGWKSAKHRQQWNNTLAAHVFPIIGSLPAQAIDTGLVLKVLEPIWTTRPETASRIRGRIESVLDYAKARGYRDGENPARWRGGIAHLVPATAKVAKVKHHAALPYAELPAFMAALRQHDGVAARALEYLVLTPARTGEVLGARWDEVDLQAKVWTVPPERMKGGKTHRVPLSPRAVAIVREQQSRRESDYLFPGMRGGAALSATSLSDALHAMGRANVTVHGFRSCFRDWVSECTAFPSEVAEMALAHITGTEVERAYRRGDMFDKRRKLMDAWATFAERPVQATGKIVAMKRPA
jgi:integrase